MNTLLNRCPQKIQLRLTGTWKLRLRCAVLVFNNDSARSLYFDAFVLEAIVHYDESIVKYCSLQAKLPVPSGEAISVAYTVLVLW